MFGMSRLQTSATLAAVVAGRPPFSLVAAAAPGAMGPTQMKILGAALFLVAPVSACEDENKVYCMDGLAYTDNTFVEPITPTRTCYEECGTDCCTGPTHDGVDPCDGGRFTVCKDGSCDGQWACREVGGNGGMVGLISGPSCVGERACEYAGEGQGFIGFIFDSCYGDVRTCVWLGREWKIWNQPNPPGYVEGVSSSCHGHHTCDKLGCGGRVGLISESSCIGDHACLELGTNGGVVGSISGGSCTDSQSCKQIGGSRATVGNIVESCHGFWSCIYLGGSSSTVGNVVRSCTEDQSCQSLGGNGRVGNVYESCQGYDACRSLAYHNTGFGQSLVQCCNWGNACTQAVHDNPHPSYAPLDTACPTNTIPPSQAPTPLYPPTQAPTVPGPWEVNLTAVTADFSTNSELSLEYEVGVGRAFSSTLFQTGCEVPVNTSLYTASDPNVQAIDDSLQKLTLTYDFELSEVAQSNDIWNSSSSELKVCNKLEMVIPNDDIVVTQDFQEITIEIDLVANFNLNVTLAEGTVENATDAVDFQYAVRGYKCNAATFDEDPTELAPNDELDICVVSTDANIALEQLVNMNSKQGDTEVPIVTGGSAVVAAITSVEPATGPTTRMVVNTRLPLNEFTFANGEELTIEGAVLLQLVGRRLKGDRKLRNLEDSVIDDGPKEAAFQVKVVLKPENGVGPGDEVPVGSSAGNVISKYAAAIGLISIVTLNLM